MGIRPGVVGGLGLAHNLVSHAWGGEAALEEGFEKLFPQDGVPAGWSVRRWDDVSQRADAQVVWQVRDGVLHGAEPRGTWLMSDREFGDFILRFEFQLGPQGNSGCALRAPMTGDPAFDGLELQMADRRYTAEMKEAEQTGGIYRAIAPRAQVYRPTEWNTCEVTLQGSHLRVALNDQVIHDLDLDQQTQIARRHDGSAAPLLKDRPRRGHIGFQELSRGEGHVQIRQARIKILP
jgi:hypothetical protein